jgi:GTP-binding protein
MVPMPTGKFGDYLRAVFPSLDFVPIAFITAKSGRNVHALLNLAQHLHKQAGARVSTGDLNRVLRQAVAAQAPPLRQNRRPKIYFGTQVATHPPTIVLFTNGPQLFDPPYQRYLLKTFRDHLPFNDVPIKLYLRHRHREDQAAEEEPDRAPVEEPPRPRPRTVQVDGRAAPPRARDAKKKREPGRGSELWKD